MQQLVPNLQVKSLFWFSSYYLNFEIIALGVLCHADEDRTVYMTIPISKLWIIGVVIL